jgi:hypothetical protein
VWEKAAKVKLGFLEEAIFKEAGGGKFFFVSFERGRWRKL